MARRCAGEGARARLLQCTVHGVWFFSWGGSQFSWTEEKMTGVFVKTLIYSW